MLLRPYQRDAVEAVFDQWRSVRSTMLVLPTGLGKTVCFASIADRVKGRVLVLAHSEELVWQARAKILQVTGEEPAVEMAEHKAHAAVWQRRVVVGTIQTQRARMERFDPAEFGAVVIDECHHAAAATYRRVIAHYGKNPGCRILGVTATPDRTDGYALGGVFDSVAYHLPLHEAIGQGWLVPIRQQPIHIHGLDWSGVSVTGGDLNTGEMGDACMVEKVPQEIADTVFREVGPRKAITFVPTVAVANLVAEILNRHRAGCAAAVSGGTPKDERRDILARFARGHLQHLVNCMVLTEGFDDPGVEVVCLARPTKSRALFAQMIGRGTRALPGIVDGPPDAAARRDAIAASRKPSLEVLDLRGNCGRHKLVTAVDLLGGIPLPELDRDEVNREAEAIMERKGRAITVEQAIEEAAQEIGDRRRRAEEERQERRRKERAEQDRRRHLRAKARYERGALIDPFDVCDLDTTPQEREPVGRPISQKQREFLERQGVDADALRPADQRKLLNEIFRRMKTGQCSYKQARILARHGHPTDVSRAEASRIIDTIFTRGRAPVSAAPAQPNPEWF